MIVAMLLASATAAASPAPMTAVDAERAFAADAQRRGQWTAFRATAHYGAIMFTPLPVYAQDFLRGRKDPLRSVQWWPSLSWQSCDGASAVNHGRWRDGAKGGTFTTVWHRIGGEWKWTYDGIKSSAGIVPAKRAPVVRRASCRNLGQPLLSWSPVRLPSPDSTVVGTGESGMSQDQSLKWTWTTDAKNHRRFMAELWNGRRLVRAIEETVAPE